MSSKKALLAMVSLLTLTASFAAQASAEVEGPVAGLIGEYNGKTVIGKRFPVFGAVTRFGEGEDQDCTVYIKSDKSGVVSLSIGTNNHGVTTNYINSDVNAQLATGASTIQIFRDSVGLNTGDEVTAILELNGASGLAEVKTESHSSIATVVNPVASVLSCVELVKVK